MYSLAHLTLIECTPAELVYIAARAGYDAVSPRLIKMNIRDEFSHSPLTKEQIQATKTAINTTGIKDIDSIQTGELCIEAMNFSREIISSNGFFISKIFMGGSFNEIVAVGKKIFKELKVFKPQSSRKDSKESFIICKKLR